MDLQGLEKQRIGFITFRAHVSQPQLFEDFFAVFLPYISLNFPIYTYSIEKDDSSDRHLHMAVAVDDKIYDAQKLEQKIIKQKWYKDLCKRLVLEPTRMNIAWKLLFNKDPEDDTVTVRDKVEDKMKIIGYIHKSINRRTEISGLSQSLITTCCDFYFANSRMKNSTNNDWKLLTPKNVYHLLPEIIKNEEQDVLGHDLLYYLSINKVGIANITSKQLKTAVLQLKINQEKNDLNLKLKLNQEYDWEDFQFTPGHNLLTKEDQVTKHKLKYEIDTLKDHLDAERATTKRLRERIEKLTAK